MPPLQPLAFFPKKYKISLDSLQIRKERHFPFSEEAMHVIRSCFLIPAALLLAAICTVPDLVSAAQTPAPPQAGKPVEDAPQKSADRTTVVNVRLEGSDSLGARLSTRLKERFNQSSLFRLNADEERDAPELRLLLSTAPEFPARPGVGSVYGVCWVFSQGKGYLGYLLAREVGTVNADDLDALVDRLVERTDGIAAKYANLWK